MGFLRFLLALSVIVAHSTPFFGLELLPGNMAVEAFFIISGFYMAMVLTEKYFKIDRYYKLFITNRFLRIYPVYWLVLLIIVLYYFADGFKTSNYHTLQLYADYWHRLNPGTFLYLIITNIMIIGQEFALFFTVEDNGSLLFTTHFLDTKMPLFKFIIDIPLWSVSLESVFYLISPALVSLKSKYLLGITIVLLLIRLISKVNGVIYDPVIYRLLPYQIVYFLLGILSYNLYNYLKTFKIPLPVHLLLLFYIAVFTITYGNISASEVKDCIYLTSVAIAVPFLFELSKSNQADKFIGELSYPMYISHLLFLDISRRLLIYCHIDQSYLSVLASLLTVIGSVFLVQIVSKRIEFYRAKRVLKAR